MKTAAIVNVNSHRIKQNVGRLSRGEKLEPVLAVRASKSATPAYRDGDVVIVDAGGVEVGRVRYEAAGGLRCGARVYLELFHEPRIEPSVQ